MKISHFGYKASQLLPYIDWSYFFHAWGIKPDKQHTREAVHLKNDAIALLNEKSDEKVLALFRLCEARSEGDNLILDGELLPLLRQQHARNDSPNLCLSDYVSPTKDHVGLFATSMPVGFEERESDDPYRHMLTQTLADRLTEAAASLLHSNVRTQKELWGYAPDEKFTPQELNSEPYAGIRPAVGYPSLPDQTIIFVIDKLLDLSQIGITLTTNGAMHPHSSVCGLMFAHPAAQYFNIGKISYEQLQDYARRRNIPTEEIKKFLSKNL
ncbi:MAG: 5-methyltetrahydrofolate--homocysteine methyltransferase [Bacteroidaceae bacterium]|nr:5-methyltetrahydrofolate--homocysteine methyltransferase [Bacteroidaceae bacterium]